MSVKTSEVNCAPWPVLRSAEPHTLHGFLQGLDAGVGLQGRGKPPGKDVREKRPGQPPGSRTRCTEPTWPSSKFEGVPWVSELMREIYVSSRTAAS
jgi:hypothetical protein